MEIPTTEGSIMECGYCGGELVSLGTLGSIWHLRCRDCGVNWSYHVEADDLWTTEEKGLDRAGYLELYGVDPE